MSVVAPRTAAYVWLGGRRVAAPDGGAIRSPYDGSVAGRMASATPDQVRAALDGAVAAGPPAALERAAILERAADGYEHDVERAARLIGAEAGICLKHGRHEVRRAIATLRAAATQARRLAGRDWEAPYLQPGETPVATLGVVAEPVTVAVAITPFNHPLNQVVHKVAPAIAAGAALVLKPSEKAPLSALRLAEVLAAAGLPADQLNVVTGPAAPLVETLVTDPRVELVSFTGSAAVGRLIARTMAAGGNELVRFVPELGGNAALAVLADCDLERAARVALGAFDNAGQRCTAINRICVEASIADRFVQRLTELTLQLRHGDPLNGATDVGPVIDEAAARRIEGVIRDAVADGARLRAGGERDGALVAPAVLDDVAPRMEVVASETFGPVAAVIRVGGVEDCVRIVRSDRQRLAGAIMTSCERTAREYARAIGVGQFSWNGPPGHRTEAAPFGGFGESGNGEKEGVVHATESMLRLRTFYRH